MASTTPAFLRALTRKTATNLASITIRPTKTQELLLTAVPLSFLGYKSYCFYKSSVHWEMDDGKGKWEWNVTLIGDERFKQIKMKREMSGKGKDEGRMELGDLGKEILGMLRGRDGDGEGDQE